MDGVDESAESVADVGAADLAAAEARASPGVKPKRIESRVRMVEIGSPRQDILPYISRIYPVYLPYISPT